MSMSKSPLDYQLPSHLLQKKEVIQGVGAEENQPRKIKDLSILKQQMSWLILTYLNYLEQTASL